MTRPHPVEGRAPKWIKAPRSLRDKRLIATDAGLTGAAGPAPEPVKPPATCACESPNHMRGEGCGVPLRGGICGVCEEECGSTPAAKPMSGCELVDCDRPEPHAHQGRCEHPNPGDGSCDNCRCAKTRP